MSRTVLPAALARPRHVRAPSRALVARERFRLLLQTALVAVQVAWFTLVGWIGATIALLPVALRGAPLGRKAERRVPWMRLIPPLDRLRMSRTAEESAGR